jgi:hypothetical protein
MAMAGFWWDRLLSKSFTEQIDEIDLIYLLMRIIIQDLMVFQ